MHKRVVTLLSVYAPQSGLNDVDKDLFFDQLRAVTARSPRSEFLLPSNVVIGMGT